MDESEQIRDMVAELENSILSGLILVLIVIFIFLGLANAFFVALAIPISMLITFVVLYMTGTTLNMVVLFSLILALGMLVDNGIVVVENIHRHLQGSGDPVAAAKSGTAEVAWPIISSTLTTVAAFAPMFFWPGIWGKFMIFLPETLTISLLASLFVGLIVNPALASRFMRRKPLETVRETRKTHPLLRLYGETLRFCLRWRLPVIGLAFSSLVVITALFFSTAKIEFVPETEPYRAFIDIDAPEGTRLEVTDAIAREVERRVAEFAEHVDYIIVNVGSRGVEMMSLNAGGGGSSHIGRVTLDFPKLADATMKPSEIVQALRHRFEDIAGAEVRINVEEQGPPAKPPVNVELSGADFNRLAEIALRVAEKVEEVPDAVDIRDDYEKGKPEIRVNVDREQALLTGLNTRFIGETVQAAIQGRKAGDYREGDEEYDVTVRFPRDFREDLTKLASLTMVSLQGLPVPFSAVATLEQGAGLGVVRRIDRKRTVTVSSEVENRPGPEVLSDVKVALSDFSLPPGYSMAFTGENEDMEETESFLGRAFVIAVFLIALVLVSQFNSLLQPFIILTSVLLSLAGVFLGLYVYNMSFGVLMTGIGCISLAGVVVNNAIVLLDFINQRRAEGVATNEAIVQAGITRFRPVMLTAVTTVLGLVPMAQGISFDFFKWEWVVGGESSEWWGPMAVAVMFGLSFATMLTLIVVPVLYSLLYAWRDKKPGSISAAP
jgi:multidrug efflux pump subunit AcrB